MKEVMQNLHQSKDMRHHEYIKTNTVKIRQKDSATRHQKIPQDYLLKISKKMRQHHQEITKMNKFTQKRTPQMRQACLLSRKRRILKSNVGKKEEVPGTGKTVPASEFKDTCDEIKNGYADMQCSEFQYILYEHKWKSQ